MIEEIIAFVNESFEHSIFKRTAGHCKDTMDWLLYFNPHADEAMQIAAYAHDISRAFRTTTTEENNRDRDFDDLTYLQEHQTECARIMSEFLIAHHYDVHDTGRVVSMILHHEIGGDPESDLIKDVDSMSYFSRAVHWHIKNTAPILGKAKVQRKLDWMYQRITSEEIKKAAYPLYMAACKELDVLKC